MDQLRQVKIQDGEDATKKAGVTSINELKTTDFTVKESLSELIKQQKLTNLYLENIWGQGKFKINDLEE